MFGFQSFPKVGLVFEFEIITFNGVIDEVVAQRFERQILSNSVKRIHHHAIVGETIGRAEVFEFHTAGGCHAEHEEQQNFVHFKFSSLFHLAQKDVVHCGLNSHKGKNCRFTSIAEIE